MRGVWIVLVALLIIRIAIPAGQSVTKLAFAPTSAFPAGTVLATAALLKLGTDGTLDLYSLSGSNDYVIDIVGDIE